MIIDQLLIDTYQNRAQNRQEHR